ncbi:prenyltransferase/squalene oxidase repeat-containing protein [Nocardioides sp.]|uniref:prenyltransferase/squalene oxidase repeat-containing protein n=1 Tax=Nocardioides sp. TaxID=35761 RepID=UPI00260A22FD|nr:prenyltransferase/squalene oxidase repeat-containing protein [Nocardioides sp.]
MTRTTLRATFVALTASALAVSAIAPASAARAGAAEEKRAVQWLAGELGPDGLMVNEEFAFTDVGLSIDAGLALLGAGRKGAVARDIATAAAGEVESYTQGGEFDPGAVYAGATAKLAAYTVLTGGDPTDVGGTDLVAQLEGVTADAGPSAGRIADQSDFGDFANTIGQAFAATALSRAGSSEAGAAVEFLLAQQCADGYFRLSFTADAAAEDQSCDADGGQPSVDTTALVLTQLLEVRGVGSEASLAISRAAGWLESMQAENGSFPTGVEGEASNSNSTGLAGWALAEVGSCGKARKAARWVKRLQVAPKHSETPLDQEIGAIAFDRAAFRAGKADGITDRDQWRRATAQATAVLENLSKATCRR